VTSRVLVVGDVMLDVVVRPTAPTAPTSDTPSHVRVGRGGSGANLAVALRGASDVDVVFAGVAGDDAAARIVAADLEECGIHCHLATVSGATGVVVSLVSLDGERAMMTDRGVNGELQFEHVVDALDTSLVHLHVSGYTALDERTRPLVSKLLLAASELGATTSVDVCSVGPLLSVGVSTFREATRHATMLFANEEEALALAGESDVVAALEELSQHWNEIVITRGPRGAMAHHDRENFSVPAQGDVVLDTTGAGDCATGTYLAHRLAHVDVETALNEAMSAAARVVERLGSRP